MKNFQVPLLAKTLLIAVVSSGFFSCAFLKEKWNELPSEKQEQIIEGSKEAFRLLPFPWDVVASSIITGIGGALAGEKHGRRRERKKSNPGV